MPTQLNDKINGSDCCQSMCLGEACDLFIIFHALFACLLHFVCYADLCMKMISVAICSHLLKPLIYQPLFFFTPSNKKKILCFFFLPFCMCTFFFVPWIDFWEEKKTEFCFFSHRTNCVREHQCHSVYFTHSFN